MIAWEAWCYRCHDRDGGEEPDEHACRERVEEFRRDHRGSCGMGTGIGYQLNTAAPGTFSMTGDGHPRPGGPT